MDKLIVVTEFEEAVDGLRVPDMDNEIEVVQAELEDLHHPIDIEEEGYPNLECEQDSYEKLIGLFNGDKHELLAQLQDWKLIPNEGQYLCPNCSFALKLYSDTSRLDGWRWKCNNMVSFRKRKRKPCNTRVEFRKGTFFEKMHIDMSTLLSFVHLWIRACTLKYIRLQTGIAVQTAVNWASLCREVLFHAFITHPEKLGGPRCTVEIEESKFGRKESYQGRVVQGHWVIGGYERGTGRVFMLIVEDRKATTLVSIIEEWIRPGTTIMSDCWKAHYQLGEKEYEHLKVNHSINFVEPDTGDDTNSIESSWRAAKAVMSSGGRTKAGIPVNLARYMFNKRCKCLAEDRIVAFFKLAGKLYDPLNPQQPHEDGSIPDDVDDVF